MSEDKSQPTTNRIPTLVQYCQRVASLNIESISGLGADISYELASPILDYCSASTLMRIEDASPHLKKDTNLRWKDLCNQDFLIESTKYLNDSSEPASWRVLYEELKELRERKLEEAGSRLRNSRLDEEQRRRERNIKITDRLPPMKRSRLWGAPVQPKTLFQKTKSEASKMQRLRLSQTQQNGLNRIVSNGISAKPSIQFPLAPIASQSANPNPRVVVRAVPARVTNPLSQVKQPTALSQSMPPKNIGSGNGSTSVEFVQGNTNFPYVESTSKLARAIPPRKKSPTSSLFIPKHRTRTS